MESVKDLGDGLILRPATKRDTDALVKFQIHAFANPDTGELDHYLGGWTRDLMRGRHPNFKPGDFLVVQDTKTNTIVSSTCLISQTWCYDEIPFGVGRIEIVATDAAYRRRGLVREQFRLLHEWSAQRGELVQAITGIPYYYRQFGYEFALNLAPARQTFVPQQIPELKKGEREAYRLRRATRKDLPFVAQVYQHGARRSLVHCEHNIAQLAYQQFFETDKFNGHRAQWCVIESRTGERVGALLHRLFVFQRRVNCYFYDLLPGVAWQAATPSVLRGLAHTASKLQVTDGKPFSQLSWYVDDNHPLVELFHENLGGAHGGYAWYLRVPDLPAFLERIAPVLEKRLGASPLKNYMGVLRLNFYTGGVEMIFENGKLRAVQPWCATAGDYGQSGFGDAMFPELTFLKLLFGYRALSELEAMFPDCTTANERDKALLNILFPKLPSHVLPIH